MFGKKCNGCGEKVSEKYNFCPYCGSSSKGEKKKGLGMLGENDFDEIDNFMGESFIEKIGGKMINNMFKMIEKEMQNEIKRKNSEVKNQPRSNFQLFINGKKINLDNAQIKTEKSKKKAIFDIPSEPLKNFSKYEKKEPEANVRRLSDKVIYEIDMPGVKSDKDVSIINLENGLEIRGVGNKTAYHKTISVNLPITDINVSKGKLILELGYE